eukprot:3518143-Ditylum_brightwellii.AAC.1
MCSPITDAAFKGSHIESTPPNDVQKSQIVTQMYKTFREYIATLNTWEQRLLKHVVGKYESYAFLKVHLQLSNDLLVVTDGGKFKDDGYFGWVIATGTTILWEARGYVQSNPELLESLRTEGMSPLALMTFLKHYCLYHGVTIQKETSIQFTDNKGIVGQMNWFQIQAL